MYRPRKFSGRLAFSLSAADSGKKAPVFGSFRVSNGIRQLASLSGLVSAAKEIAAPSARARNATMTCARIQRHNDDARISVPQKHAPLPRRNSRELHARAARADNSTGQSIKHDGDLEEPCRA